MKYTKTLDIYKKFVFVKFMDIISSFFFSAEPNVMENFNEFISGDLH